MNVPWQNSAYVPREHGPCLIQSNYATQEIMKTLLTQTPLQFVYEKGLYEAI